MRDDFAILALAACVVATSALAQQDPPPAQPVAPEANGPADGSYVYDAAWMRSGDRDDYRELFLIGGFRFRAPNLGIEVRGRNAVLLSDLEQTRSVIQRPDSSGPPRRGIEPPEPRRRLSTEQLRERLDRTLRAVGSAEGVPKTRSADQAIDLFRYLYFEGGVVVVRDGIEVLSCSRMWISPLDDRIVVEEAEIRYFTPGKDSRNLLVVRGDRLVKQGARWTGRDLTITTCTAGESHAALAVGEAEIIERDGEFEVVARGQTLQIGGTSVLPLPDARIFTKSQSEFPIKRASGSYSQKEGSKAEVVFGLPWNKTGGALHHAITGRPAHEFRGDWELGVGWVEKRGVPLDGELHYRAQDLYDGSLRGFWLDDRGPDLREIQGNFDGSPRDNEMRGLVSTENRIRIGPTTHLDLVAFRATDPAVLPEFFPGEYRIQETPETSSYLHHSDGNRLFTVGTRWNLDDFSYRDDRALAERFVEELPVVTYDWIAQPIGETPWQTPIVVDAATELGQRRSAYDDRAGVRVSDRTFRADQVVEVSAPFAIGPWNLRPYTSARGTWFDEAVDGRAEGRIAFEGGMALGTRLSKTFSWSGDDGPQALRHVIAPKVTWRNRFRVDDPPSEFFAFDATDTLQEQELVRVEVRNLLQQMGTKKDAKAGPAHPRDVVLLDLAQDFWPDAARDNGGESIGLFYYDLLLRPRISWLPFEDFAFAIYGDHDWKEGMRTLDTELRVGRIAGITWTVDYREDRAVKGAVGVSGSTRLFDRWNVFGGSQRDLTEDRWLSYSFGLVRNDHDWAISANASYNPFADETTFRLEFLPRFGGMNRGHADRFGGSTLQASEFATNY
ncbi:MAG: hypothetical protein JNK78_13405 [Planctomycetes bacterium]|nr:hypothetical protein [Planctomycetota bacterium]